MSQATSPAAPDGEDRVRVGLFFALFPPAATAARIAELARQLQSAHRLRGAPTLPHRLHCTLHPIDLRKHGFAWAVTRARDAAGRVDAEQFTVAFDRTASFRGSQKHPFVLRGGDKGLAPLIAFRRALGAALYHVEIREAATHSYTPHVTLLYGGDRLVDEHPISPIRWRVDRFKLIVSPHGHDHREAGCWPLRG